MVAQMARDLQPAVVVLEDVDLVAEDRGFGPGANPVLFALLDAMDGAAADADLLFLLTTNRADLLEPALAARPGRVDVAVEIPLPDAEARRRLLAVYTRGVPLALERRRHRRRGGPHRGRDGVLRQGAGPPLGPRGTHRRPPGRRAAVPRRWSPAPWTTCSTAAQAVTRALLGVGTAGAGPDGGRAAGGHQATGWLAAGPAGPAAYRRGFEVTYDQ